MSSDAWLLPGDGDGRLDEERSIDIGPPLDAESNEETPPQVDESVETARDTEPPD
jgi:hypothetical protein